MSDRLRLTRDGLLLFLTRAVRMFAYGLVAIVLLLYLTEVGLTSEEQALLLSLTLIGDTAISLWLATHADQFGRRKTLIIGSLLMLLAGVTFSFSTSFLMLLFAATVGVISPSGSEVGPFQSVEHAALTELAGPRHRTTVFAWYHVIGISAAACGALCSGLGLDWAQRHGWQGVEAYRPILFLYSTCGLAMAGLSLWLGPAVEASVPPSPLATRWGLHRSGRMVGKLSVLFAVDAFGGGFIVQAITAAWLTLRFGLRPAELGYIFFAANILSGASALAAGWFARRIGLINTMVFTHLPSNVLLLLMPFMPDAVSAVILLLVRYSISQMDVPTRQAFTMAVVAPDERSAAAGVTTVARSIGASASPGLAAMLLAQPGWISTPFLLAGGVKIAYDLTLFAMFSRRGEDAEPS